MEPTIANDQAPPRENPTGEPNVVQGGKASPPWPERPHTVYACTLSGNGLPVLAGIDDPLFPFAVPNGDVGDEVEAYGIPKTRTVRVGVECGLRYGIRGPAEPHTGNPNPPYEWLVEVDIVDRVFDVWCHSFAEMAAYVSSISPMIQAYVLSDWYLDHTVDRENRIHDGKIRRDFYWHEEQFREWQRKQREKQKLERQQQASA